MTIEQETIALLKSGNREAFREVFNAFFKPLCGFANRYVVNHAEVEDLVQEVFVVFWENKANFSHSNSIKTFFYTSVRNKCLNHLKQLAVRLKHEDSLVRELESDHLIANVIIEDESFNQLYIEIKKLPESSKKIMLLALKGLKNKEIASELNISENTVKTQKKIAYRKLKDKLSPSLNAILLSL